MSRDGTMDARSPSAWRARAPAVGLAALGLLVAAYLAAFQAGRVDRVWDPIFGSGSERVLRIGAGLPVPDAALGAAGYLAEVLLGIAGGTDRWHRRPWVVLAYGVVVAAMAVAAVLLVAIQAVVVRAGCTLCLASAAISLAIAVLAFPEVRAAVAVLRGHRPVGARHPDPVFDRRTR